MKEALTLLTLLLLSPFKALPAEDRKSDSPNVLIYGATPAGISAALTAAKRGSSVLLVEPYSTIGGLMTNGLSHSDFRTFEGLTGAFLDHTKRVNEYYFDRYGAYSQQAKGTFRGTHAEPHVNVAVFESALAEQPGITVLRRARLLKVQLDEKDRTRIKSVSLESKEDRWMEVEAAVFIDASYEGDLMARAGVPYAVGREARAAYGESLAPKTADGQLQGYNFRLIMTRRPELRVMPSAPKGYSREQFIELLPLLSSGKVKTVFCSSSGGLYKAQLPPLPNGKHDVNDVSRAIVRLSLPSINNDWPDGSVQTREQLFQAHLLHNVGMLYFLQNDPEVPKRFREEARQWGWCRDEFTNTAHLPEQLYVREARRMKGVHIFTERDTEPEQNDVRSRFHPDSIAMGDYSHNCHGTGHSGPRFGGRHTGEFYKKAAPYQIPYGTLLPRKMTNLLVPVAASSSHVGFCALRLEPIWMSLGQAAGIAAHIAHSERTPVQAVNALDIQQHLHREGAATIYVSDVLPTHPDFEAVQWWGARGGLHGVAPPLEHHGQWGKHIRGQYFQAFPGHAVQSEKKLDKTLRQKWMSLARKLGCDPERLAKARTRGEFIRLAFSANADKPEASGEKPNIILILADDLGYADIGAYGNKLNRTPNLDRMAREGLRFTDFHTNAANCSPTRATILTGQYQQRCGIDEGALGEGAKGLPQSTITIAERLRDAGYATGLIGKWHLGYEPTNGPTRHGFDQFVGHLHGATDYLSRVDRFGRRDWWHNEKAVEEEGHNTTLITEHSVRFIEKHRDEPFFLMVSHSAIHFPWQTTADQAHRVPGKRYEDAVGKLGPHAAGPVQPVLQGMIEELDDSVGHLLSAIQKHNLTERTLVFFTSDNGGIVRQKGLPATPENRISDNSPWRGQKHGLHEGGHRVPAIAWWPGRIQAHRVSDELSMTFDLSPTFLDLAGLDVSASKSDGLSLGAHLQRDDALPERTVFWKSGRKGLEAVRWRDWKLIRNQNRIELFNLRDNPTELANQNLASDRPDIADELLVRFGRWTDSLAESPVNAEADSPLMLAGDWVPDDPHQIDYVKLPRVPAEHVIISDVREHAGTRVHQHAYLAYHDGGFWAMWSDGPGGPRTGVTPERHRNVVPAHDMPGTRNSFATSKDGLRWSKPADLTGPPRKKGFGWIARGLWQRDGELLALSSHFDAPGYEGLGLSLEAFRWNGAKWEAHGTVLDDSMNNFPPKRLPSREWMMTRRDHQRQVSVMIGGTKAFNDWRINPLAAYGGNGRPEEPYWYVLPDGKTIAGLIRDNGRSKFLLRTFSHDSGKTWSKMHRTNFPDATSKFFVHRTSRGYYVMVSNSNPRKRDPLTLAISQDGLVFTKLFWLIGGRHVDYPHIIEHDGHLLVAFSGAKQTMEVMKVSLDELERLRMPKSVELTEHLPPAKEAPKQERPPHWIDLGDEGKTLWAAADLIVPKAGKRAAFSLATASGAERVILGIDKQGRLTAELYGATTIGPKLEPGSRHSLLIHILSHREKPDELFVQLGTSGEIPLEPEKWTLSNQKGSSKANLSRIVRKSNVSDPAGFDNIRVALTRKALSTKAP